MKKRKQVFAAISIAAVITAVTIFPASALSLTPEKVWGLVSRQSDTVLVLSNQNQNAYDGDIILNISEETKLLDAESGMPISIDDISDGETIYAYTGPAMTASLPPQTIPPVILANIPADQKVPDYITVESMEKTANGYLLKSADGLVFQVPSDCSISPYLTRNLIDLEDLYKGASCLIWSDTKGTADRILMFAPYYNEETSFQTGWVLVSGAAGTTDAQWTYYNPDGTLAKGWILDSGKWYFLDLNTGIMKRGFIQVDGKTYYMQQDGSMATTPKTFIPDENGALHLSSIDHSLENRE